jgi:hypothetical protein
MRAKPGGCCARARTLNQWPKRRPFRPIVHMGFIKINQKNSVFIPPKINDLTFLQVDERLWKGYLLMDLGLDILKGVFGHFE